MATRAGGGNAAVMDRARTASDVDLGVTGRALHVLVLAVEHEVGEGRPMRERRALPLGGGVAAGAVRRPGARIRELRRVGIRVTGGAVGRQRLVADHTRQVDAVAPAAGGVLVRAGEPEGRLAVVIEVHLGERGDAMAVGAAGLLDARRELAAMRVRVAGVAAARVARHAEARQDHLILSPPLLQEGADGGRAGLECRIGAMAPGAGRGEMPPL